MTEPRPDKKKMLLVMNCAAIEIAQQLASSAEFMGRYDVEVFSTYVEMADALAQARLVDRLREADVVVSQDVQACSWLRNDEMARHVRRDCVFVRLAFWRFNGYWPLELPRFYNSLWYLPDEHGPGLDFADYISSPIPGQLIADNFSREIDKFRRIEARSDLKMVDFVLDNHRRLNLFSDSWHPTAVFYHQVVKYILSRIDDASEIGLPPNIHINRDRYRLVFDAVAERLGLEFDPSCLRFHDHVVTREVFYDFCQHARTALVGTDNPLQAAEAFEVWRRDRGLGPHAFDVLRLARPRASAGGADERSTDLDLGDFRQISGLAFSPEAGGPVTVETSVDGASWEHLACSGGASSPTRSVQSVRLAKYVRLGGVGPGEATTHGVRLFSEVIGQPVRR